MNELVRVMKPIIRIGFRFAPQFNEGILQLQENGALAKLEKKWWQERRGGGACSVRQGNTT